MLRDICLEKIPEVTKIQKMAEHVRDYLFEFEMIYFDELVAKTSFTPEDFLQAVEKAFKKKIGGLPFEARRQKIVTYFEKKKFRDWKKKINYDCRKQVANSRPRIKGKFVTQEQAEK